MVMTSVLAYWLGLDHMTSFKVYLKSCVYYSSRSCFTVELLFLLIKQHWDRAVTQNSYLICGAARYGVLIGNLSDN